MSSRSPRRSNSRGRSRSPLGDRDLKGRVVTLHSENGFGFVELLDDPGHDHIFFHSEHIIDDIDIRQFREGDIVIVDKVPSKKKPGRFDGVNVRPDDPETKDRRSDPGKRLRRSRRDRSRSRGRGRDYGRRRRSPSYDRGHGRRKRSVSYDRHRRSESYDRRYWADFEKQNKKQEQEDQKRTPPLIQC